MIENKDTEHNYLCPIASFHNAKKCPLLGIEDNIQDIGPIRFLWQELSEDPLRAARGIIGGLIMGGLIWLLVAIAFIVFKH